MNRCSECGAMATMQLGRTYYCNECGMFVTGGTQCQGCGHVFNKDEKVHSICGDPMCDTCINDNEVINKYKEVQDGTKTTNSED